MRPSEVRGELTDAAQRLAVLAADPAWIAGLSPAERRSVGKVLSGANEARAHSKFYDLFPPAGPFRRERHRGRAHPGRVIRPAARLGKGVEAALDQHRLQAVIKHMTPESAASPTSSPSGLPDHPSAVPSPSAYPPANQGTRESDGADLINGLLGNVQRRRRTRPGTRVSLCAPSRKRCERPTR